MSPPTARRGRNALLVALSIPALGLLVGAIALGRPSAVAGPPDAGVAVAPSTLTLECTPKASVILDGTPVGSTPYLAADLSVGEHQLVLRAPGYLEQRRVVKVNSAGEKLQLVLTLEKEAPVAVDAGEKIAPVQVAARANGKLNLRTTPWTTVYLGKRKLGDTPLVGVALPAGSHVLRVVNPEAGVESSIEITIQANKTTNENLVLK